MLKKSDILGRKRVEERRLREMALLEEKRVGDWGDWREVFETGIEIGESVGISEDYLEGVPVMDPLIQGMIIEVKEHRLDEEFISELSRKERTILDLVKSVLPLAKQLRERNISIKGCYEYLKRKINEFLNRVVGLSQETIAWVRESFKKEATIKKYLRMLLKEYSVEERKLKENKEYSVEEKRIELKEREEEKGWEKIEDERKRKVLERVYQIADEEEEPVVIEREERKGILEIREELEKEAAGLVGYRGVKPDPGKEGRAHWTASGEWYEPMVNRWLPEIGEGKRKNDILKKG